MGPGTEPVGPMVIEIDRSNPDKDITALDIELPKLKPRIEEEGRKLLGGPEQPNG